MRTWITIMMFAVLALSGCAQETPTETTDDAGTGTGDADGSEPETGDPQGGESSEGTADSGNNTAPTAILTADVENGTAPLAVNFTIDGSDADGDNLTWSLDLDGDGEADASGETLPATANHTFDVGNHTVTLTVSDGINASTADLLISAVEETVEEADPNAPVDKGWYVFDPVTKLCHVKDYDTLPGGVIYNSALGGGDWFIAETNDVDGLQIADNHPFSPIGPIPVVGSWAQDIDECEDGDQVVQ